VSIPSIGSGHDSCGHGHSVQAHILPAESDLVRSRLSRLCRVLTIVSSTPNGRFLDLSPEDGNRWNCRNVVSVGIPSAEHSQGNITAWSAVTCRTQWLQVPKGCLWNSSGGARPWARLTLNCAVAVHRPLWKYWWDRSQPVNEALL
jgi:hypothetical protein